MLELSAMNAPPQTNAHVARAIQIAGGQKALAQLLNVSPQLVSQWLHRRRPVGPARARAIERALFGQVTAQQLRPDVFGDPVSPAPAA